MSQTSIRQLAIYAAILVAIAVLGSRWLDRGKPAEPTVEARPAIEVEDARSAGVTVHVAGAVRRPGVYRLSGQARVQDAVRRAGGARNSADLTQVNLAAELEDGRQIIVPRRPTGAAEVAAVAGGAPTAPGVPLNLNTATLEQLDALDGIGPATAQQILDHREANDGFGSVEELGEVPGIGEKRLASLREQVRV